MGGHFVLRESCMGKEERKKAGEERSNYVVLTLLIRPYFRFVMILRLLGDPEDTSQEASASACACDEMWLSSVRRGEETSQKSSRYHVLALGV